MFDGRIHSLIEICGVHVKYSSWDVTWASISLATILFSIELTSSGCLQQ
jgi:hypothetical protein